MVVPGVNFSRGLRVPMASLRTATSGKKEGILSSTEKKGGFIL